MSGLFTPVQSMPEWAQWMNQLNPIAYFIDVMRMILLKGSGFQDITRQFFSLLMMTLKRHGSAKIVGEQIAAPMVTVLFGLLMMATHFLSILEWPVPI